MRYRKRYKAPKGWIDTPRGQDWLRDRLHLESIQQEIERKSIAEQQMADSDERHSCSECVHGIGRHCTWNLPNGCNDFWAVQKE